MLDNPLLVLNLHKGGNNNKNGLVQQVITYVRDGRTITRKQWVRSEFADHAKKNEEQRKKTMIKQAEKEQKKHDKDVEEGNLKQALKDMAERKKMESEKRQVTEPKTEDEKEMHRKRKEIHKRAKDEEMERHEEDIKKKNKKDREKFSQNKDKKTAYGQEEQTRADAKREVDNIVRLHRDSVVASKDK